MSSADEVTLQSDGARITMDLGTESKAVIEQAVAQRSGLLQDLAQSAGGTARLPFNAARMQRWIALAKEGGYHSTDASTAEAAWQQPLEDLEVRALVLLEAFANEWRADNMGLGRIHKQTIKVCSAAA